MTKDEAKKILIEHNIWRRSDEYFDMTNHKILGEAIDILTQGTMDKDHMRLLKLQSIYNTDKTEEEIGWIAYDKAQEEIKKIIV